MSFLPLLLYSRLGSMEQEKKTLKDLVNGLFDVPEGTKIVHSFDPFDKSFIKVNWNSPNDRKSNLFNMLVDFEDLTPLRIEDNH